MCTPSRVRKLIYIIPDYGPKSIKLNLTEHQERIETKYVEKMMDLN